jgi:glycosyltransferase involved in cell wall biosynthesis
VRVLLINNYLYLRGGAERSFFAITDLLKDHGHEVIHFARRHPQNLPSAYESYFPAYHELSPLSFSRTAPAAIAQMIYNQPAAQSLSRLLQRVRPDVAHLNNIYHHLSPSILPVLARHNIPTVLHFRDGKLICPAIYMFRRGRFCNLCLRQRIWPILLHRCSQNSLVRSVGLAFEALAQDLLGFYRRCVDYYICPSQFLRSQILARGFGASKVINLPNFVSAPSTDPPPASQRYLFCASRLTVDKGMFVLLEAARLQTQIPLLIAGQGPAQQKMSNFIKHHKLIHVRLLDFQDEQSLAQLFRNATASIMPSLLPENCPNVILESAAQSCPVIASDVGGVSELINDGHDGWLIPPGQPDRLARAMSQAFTDPQLSARLGRAAAQRIVQHHNPESFYSTLIEIYRRAQELRQ